MEKGLVSILIPNFNKEEYLESTLKSIHNQEYTNWECVVVDDISTDTSWSILIEYQKKDSRFRVFQRPEGIPKGANFCRNYAYSLSKGEYIQWFDSDDAMYPWFLRKKVEYLDAHPDTPFVIARGKIKFDSDFTGNKKFDQNYFSENPIEDYLKFRLIFLTGGPLIRRHVLDETGLFNLKLRRHQEWELYFRVVLSSSHWGVIEKPSFEYVVHNNSITSRFQEKKKEVDSELVVFQEILKLPRKIFRNEIPKRARIAIAKKYLLVSTYHRRFDYSVKYFWSLVQEMASFN